ncbi:hypothetical protein CEF21_10280 [Bacillus sp. FJAT-42376]|uniref:hypothetical protein n=1 Tax=Bacillus sp. FJAT-42376 TaxID=2014076 RepID=UPI000F4EC87D|nr:hypothetical protein [Bacillus sp. FJAT-42376]AZB42645.1 hypothetical protein CEF21_10280 [Bacillus sp. FJAT-42376]
MKWLWFALIAYAILLAPGQGGMQDPVLQAYLSGKFNEANPMVTMVFSFLGIFPIVWAALYFRQDENLIPAWPFAVLSFGLGAFSLLPYLFFKGKGKKQRPIIQKLGNALSSPWVMLPLLALTICLYVYGLTQGSAEAYQKAFMQSKLVSVMTADFIVLVIYSYWWMRKSLPGQEKWCVLPLAGAQIALLRKKRVL